MPVSIGDTFGELTVVELYKDTRFNGKPRYMAECQCSCGGTWKGERGGLTAGHSKRCPACSSYSGGGEPYHGRSNGNGSAEGGYYIWRGVKSRIKNPNHHAYPYYGGRGLTMDPCWERYENFVSDMGERPSLAHSIERLDNNLGYWPSNCVWASRYDQANNKRNNHHLTANGKTQTLAEWAAETGLMAATIAKRLDYGWTEQAAVNTSVNQAKRKHRYITPKGEFQTLTEAAEAHGVTFGTIWKNVKSDRKPDWQRKEINHGPS